jgi:hypothetical protein
MPSATRPDVPPTPSLGYLADRYLQTHGYDTSSILHIYHAYQTSKKATEFTDYIYGKGLPEQEANWLWGIINYNGGPI